MVIFSGIGCRGPSEGFFFIGSDSSLLLFLSVFLKGLAYPLVCETVFPFCFFPSCSPPHLLRHLFFFHAQGLCFFVQLIFFCFLFGIFMFFGFLFPAPSPSHHEDDNDWLLVKSLFSISLAVPPGRSFFFSILSDAISMLQFSFIWLCRVTCRCFC